MGKIIVHDGYAPRVPNLVDALVATDYELVSMVRDTLQNGANPTRGNLAFGLLLERLRLPMPEFELDPEPYEWPYDARIGAQLRAPEAWFHDSIYGYPVFAPRFGYAQERSAYPKSVPPEPDAEKIDEVIKLRLEYDADEGNPVKFHAWQEAENNLDTAEYVAYMKKFVEIEREQERA